MPWFDIVPTSQIDHRLFVSGFAEANSLREHNPHNISAVLNVHQQPDAPNPDVVQMHIPFEDGEEIPQRQFIKCLGWLKFMHEAGHVILIHCAAGISRSVIITASFMHYAGIADFETALKRVKEARKIANPAPLVEISAKRMLKVFPYDGSFDSAPEHEKLIADSFEWMDATRAAQAHPDASCPMRVFLLTAPADNTPRHTIPCTCKPDVIVVVENVL